MNINLVDQRFSDDDPLKRDVPSFIEPLPPLITNPYMRTRPDKGTNLNELFKEDSETEEPELLQVYLRLKPCKVANTLYEVRSNHNLVTYFDTATMGHGRRTQQSVSKMYNFSHIFGPESTQKDIFEQVVKDNLKKLPDGHNFTLLTYGASGSGKTYTLMGTVSAPGLVPRSLEYVFRIVDAAQQPDYKPVDGKVVKLDYASQEYETQWVKKLRHISAPLNDKYRRMSVQLCNDFASSDDLSNKPSYYIWVSFIEIYNESLYDLLVPSDRKAASKLRIRDDSNGNVYVQGATQAFVRSGLEAYDVMIAGKHNLQVAATGIHAHSSRSHCVFTITMLTVTESGVHTSSVRLCDLAGCERANRTRNTGARMQESRAINASLHVLERCLHTLRRRCRTSAPAAIRVPYRESKLTRLLCAGLSGDHSEAMSMVVTINPAPDHVNETRHVLQLAVVAKDIQVNNTMATESSLMSGSTSDTTVSCDDELMRLRAENECLRFELAQAQSQIEELTRLMEEKQRSAACTMQELVDEAKDMTRQYYEKLIQMYKDRHRSEIQELLEKLPSEPTVDTQEKIKAERLARVKAEEENRHLRAQIAEKEKSCHCQEPSNVVHVDLLTDSEHESDENSSDSYDESLEPNFNKEDLNRSILIMKNLHNSTINLNDRTTGINEHLENVEKLEEKLEDHDLDKNMIKNSTYSTENEDSQLNISVKEKHVDLTEELKDDNTKLSCHVSISENVENKPIIHSKLDLSLTETIPTEFMTYKSSDSLNFNDHLNDETESKINLRGTYFINNTREQDGFEHDSVFDHSKAAVDKINTNNLRENIDEVSENVKDTFSDYGKSTNLTSECDNSLAQFEELEKCSKAYSCWHKQEDTTNVINDFTSNVFTNIKILKEKRTYFDNIDVKEKNNTDKQTNDISHFNLQSDRIKENQELSTVKEMLGPNFIKEPDLIPSVSQNEISLKKLKESISIFEESESPLIKNQEQNMDDTDKTRKSIQKLVLDPKTIDFKSHSMETDIEIAPKLITEKLLEEKLEKICNDTIKDAQQSKENNTIEDFEAIYNDITMPRPTHFELLVLKENNTNDVDIDSKRSPKYEIDKNTDDDKSIIQRYNLRHKTQMDLEDDKKGIPASKKEVKDIPSPKQAGDEENVPPLCVQSCPAKSITRSRRKLFTPRAEALEEPVGQVGDSNERISVPRPSYHRVPRARRKL